MTTDAVLADALDKRIGVVVSSDLGRTYYYVGRNAPSGWREVAGAIHLGGDCWMMRVEPAEREQAPA